MKDTQQTEWWQRLLHVIQWIAKWVFYILAFLAVFSIIIGDFGKGFLQLTYGVVIYFFVLFLERSINYIVKG